MIAQTVAPPLRAAISFRISFTRWRKYATIASRLWEPSRHARIRRESDCSLVGRACSGSSSTVATNVDIKRSTCWSSPLAMRPAASSRNATLMLLGSLGYGSSSGLMDGGALSSMRPAVCSQSCISRTYSPIDSKTRMIAAFSEASYAIASRAFSVRSASAAISAARLDVLHAATPTNTVAIAAPIAVSESTKSSAPGGAVPAPNVLMAFTTRPSTPTPATRAITTMQATRTSAFRSTSRTLSAVAS